jgi:hypothetical protein
MFLRGLCVFNTGRVPGEGTPHPHPHINIVTMTACGMSQRVCAVLLHLCAT